MKLKATQIICVAPHITLQKGDVQMDVDIGKAFVLTHLLSMVELAALLREPCQTLAGCSTVVLKLL